MNFDNINIDPFPENINRIHFGYWLSGLTDGEGHFGIQMIRDQRKIKNGLDRNNQNKLVFVLTLRSDDFRILKLIQSYFQCGNLCTLEKTKRQPNASEAIEFRISRTSDLVLKIIHQFNLFPLMSKKHRDFEIWKKAVYLRFKISCRRQVPRGGYGGTFPRWTPVDIAEFKYYRDTLRETRKHPSRKLS